MNSFIKSNSGVTADSIISVAKKHVPFLKNSENLSISEIGDGNVNYIYRIKDEDSHFSIIAKYADSYLRNSDTRQLSTDRNKIENFILNAQNELAPNSAPEVYYFDEESHCIYMEDLVEHETMRIALREGKTFPAFSRQIAGYLYNTLFKTSDLVMDPELKKNRVKHLINIDMCEISERLVFTEPYKNLQGNNSYHPDNDGLVSERIYNNSALLLEAAILKNRFKNYAQSMIHGDLHSGSIFINNNSTKVFDPEFSFYGPMGYDIGNIMGNLTINYIIAKKTDPESEFENWLRSAIPTILDEFIVMYNENYEHDVKDPMMQNEQFKSVYLQSIISDTFGYAGTEIIRRTIGAFKVMELDNIKGTAYQKVVEQELITIGTNLIMNRSNVRNGNDYLKELE